MSIYCAGKICVPSLVALPCTLPFVSAFLFNIFQTLIVIFIVGNNVSIEKRFESTISEWTMCNFARASGIGRWLCLFYQ